MVTVGGSTRLDAVQKMLRTHFGDRELCNRMNADEAVAFGAAIQAAVLGGAHSRGLHNLQLFDTTPLSLGIEIVGGFMVRACNVYLKRIYTLCK